MQYTISPYWARATIGKRPASKDMGIATDGFCDEEMTKQKCSQSTASPWPLCEVFTRHGFLVGALLIPTTDIFKPTILVLHSS